MPVTATIVSIAVRGIAIVAGAFVSPVGRGALVVGAAGVVGIIAIFGSGFAGDVVGILTAPVLPPPPPQPVKMPRLLKPLC